MLRKKRLVLEIQNIFLSANSEFSLQLPTKGYPNLSVLHHDRDQYSCPVFLTNLRQATWHSIRISLIFLIHFTISTAQEIKAWWNSYTISIFALMHRCLRASMELSQTHPAFFLCHMLRKTRLSTTVKLSRPPSSSTLLPLTLSLSLSLSLSLFFIQSVPNLPFPSFSLSHLLSAASTSAPLPHLPQTPQPLDPSLHWFSLSLSLSLSLSFKHVTQTHIQYTQIHMLSWCYMTNPNRHWKKRNTATLRSEYERWNRKCHRSSCFCPLSNECALLSPSSPSDHHFTLINTRRQMNRINPSFEIIHERRCKFSHVEQQTASSAVRPQCACLSPCPQSQAQLDSAHPPTSNSTSRKVSCKYWTP